jgi:N4-gp56 family major capsid protein
MSAITRTSLPQNFLDSASTGMRLPTPEPQYFFAKMALGSRLSLAALNAGIPTAQQFVTIAGGGMQLPPELDEMSRAADAYPEAILSVDEFGKNQGDTVKFWRDVYEGGLYTEAGRLLAEEQVISTTGQNIKAEEVPVVLKEFHGPSNAAGTAVAPYAIKNFDAKYRLNKEALSSKVSRYLRRDYVKFLDSVIRDKFRANGATGNTNVTFPSGVANAAAFVSGGTAYSSLELIMNARKSLSDREWSKFGNGRYMCLVPTSFNTQMIGDVDYRELSKVHRDGRNQLFGYIGSIQDVDFFEVSTLATYATSGATDTAVNGSTVAASVTVNEALLFGPGCVGFGTASNEQTGAMGPEVRFADDTNYGTIAKVIWYALHAFETLDTRGCQRIFWQV